MEKLVGLMSFFLHPNIDFQTFFISIKGFCILFLFILTYYKTQALPYMVVFYLIYFPLFPVDLKIYFHNAMGYDANFILKYILTHDEYKDWSIQVMMKSSNRMQKLSFLYKTGKTQRRISICDSYFFLTLSLDRIVSSLRKENYRENVRIFPRFFETFTKMYPDVEYEDIDRILRKNIFPYKFFMNSDLLKCSIEEFAKVFEPREENLIFFSESVTVEELHINYPEFKHVCEVFGCESAGDYHDLYLTCDVLQIADVFISARDTLRESHNIDLCNYIGMPAASWHAFLRFNPNLEIPLYQTTLFAEYFQSMTRGGVTSAPLRYAERDDEHSILYLDVNGLYPYVMQKYEYPCGQFIWRSFDQITHDHEKFLMEVYFPWLKNNHKGCCITVDLHVPDDLKLITDQFPFAPEHRLIRDEYYDESGEMYDFLKKWSEANDNEVMKPFMGLVGTLYDKKKYSVHWRLLEWYIQHGMKVTKVYYGVQFDEGDYLAGYVRHNINLRNQRKDELGKMVYKLMGNSVYGKTFESPFNHGSYVICRNHDKLTGLLKEGNVCSINPIDEENSIVKLDGDEVVLDKPTYIGACVTEYAKLHMYIIFYDKLARMFPDGLELVYTDTDSFIVRVKHAKNMTPEELFDYIKSVEPDFIGSIGGQLKSETGMDRIDKVIALRSKLYRYVTISGKIGKRAKGTTHAAQEKELDWNKYLETLITLRAVPTSNVQFVRSQLSIASVPMMKQSLSANDGKRYIEPDGIHTHAWGWK